MSWETLRASLELALRSPGDPAAVHFLGGEPLLQLPLIQEALLYLDRSHGGTRGLNFGLTTNGTLLDPATAALLEKHSFRIRLSFDGVAAAQDDRAPGTFARLDALLEHLREHRPELFHNLLTVTLTLLPRTVRLLPDSIEYFLGKDVRRIAIGPGLASDSEWDSGLAEELESAFGLMYDICRRHRRRTGRVPVLLFRRWRGERPPPAPGPICLAGSGESVTVDTDGRLFGCVMFATSYQDLEHSPLHERLPALGLGSIHEPGLADRLAAYPAKARRTGLFHRKELKYSACGRCGECRWRDRCLVCPATALHVPGNADPHRVSDFCCAFNQVAFRYQALFPPLPSLPEALRGRAAGHRNALPQIADAPRRGAGYAQSKSRINPQ